jgi:zona occludens toxin
MAIYAYVGLPRQGKSYNVVAEQIMPALREGRRVVTNIPLRLNALREAGAVGEVVQWDTRDLCDKDKANEMLQRDCTPGSVVVFDEMWQYLPQGKTTKDVGTVWGSLFAEHGHRVDSQGRMMQIVLVVQDLAMIAAFARALVERTFVVTKLTVIGQEKRFRVDVYSGSVTGLKPPIKRRISEQFGTYDLKVFEWYVSRTQAEEGAGSKVNEKTFDKRASALRNPFLRYVVPIGVVALFVGLWRTYQFFFGGAGVVEVERPSAEAQGRVRGSALPASPPGLSGRWRISGVLRAKADGWSMVLVDRCDGGPSRWVRWNTASCTAGLDGEVSCVVAGYRLELRAAVKDCREIDEPRRAQIDWFPANDRGSRESVSVLPSVPVGASGGPARVPDLRDGSGAGAPTL